MTTAINVVSSGKKLARVYFELDPTGKLFGASILTTEPKLFHRDSKTLEEIQNWAKETLIKMYGAGKFKLEPSETEERTQYEKAFYNYLTPKE